MIFQSSFYQSKRILLVDDCEPVRASIRGMLQQIGFEHITVVSDASAAISKAELHSFDFIVADFQLGDGLDGFQLFSELKKRELIKLNCCVTLISAESIRMPVLGMLERQPDCFILKPFTYMTLEKRLARAVQQRMAFRKVYQAIQQRQPEQAIELSEQLVKDSPLHALHALRLKGELLLQHHQPDKATKLYQQILQKRQLSWAALGLAIASMQAGQLDEAEYSLLELSKQEDTRSEALDWLIRLYLQQNNTAQALEVSYELGRALPRQALAMQVQTYIHTLCGQVDDAIRGWTKISQQVRYSSLDSAQHYLNPARLWLTHLQQSKSLQPGQQLSKAEECLQQLPKRFQTDELQLELQWLQARIAVLQGDPVPAQQAVASATPEHLAQLPMEAVMDLAMLQLALGDTKQHELVLQQLTQARVDPSLIGALQQQYSQHAMQQGKVLRQKIKQQMQKGQDDYRQQAYNHAFSRLWQSFLYMPANMSLALSLWQTLAQLPYASSLQHAVLLIAQLLQSATLQGANQQRFVSVYQKLAVPYKLPQLNGSTANSAS
ncbi:response regulator [Alkalimonas collagenimarina]|uniref:Response regulator n=1 Tax=Alkalimonas collagenimarina TaxID=400390 RepID=A0ABT9H1S8_9GAMM|nr:response regulator [Alkalimonas collagenimarina]MDP4537269.1 response regulator [Alkalimonas collagenimarina]